MVNRKTAFRSGIAVVASSLGVQFAKVGAMIVLARMLDPTDFGIVSLAAVLIGGSELFSALGMGPAIVATRADREKAAFHAMVIALSSATVLTFVVLLFADEFAAAFDRKELTGVCRAMAAMILLDALAVIPGGILMKEMKFGRLIIPRTFGPVVDMLVAVSLAIAGFGLWSLVIGHIVGSAVKLVLSLLVCPSLGWLRPRSWDGKLARDMTRFGSTNMGTGLVQYSYNHGHDIVVGKFLGAMALGFYTQAYKLANLPVNNISRMANSVLFPAYSTFGDDRKRLAKAFLTSFRLLAVLTVPMAMGLLALAPELVLYFLGEKWRDSIPLLQIFAFLSLMRPLSGASSPVFLAIHRPEYNLRTSILQGVSMLILVFAMLPFGVRGVAGAVVSAFAIGFAYNLWVVSHKVGVPIRLRNLAKQVSPVLTATAVMTAGVFLLKLPLRRASGGDHGILSIMALVASGMSIYSIVLFILDRKLVFEIIALALSAAGLDKKLLGERDGRRAGDRGRFARVSRAVKRRIARFLPWPERRPRAREGLPEGLPAEEIRPLIERYSGGSPVEVGYQHLSGWKETGAFRLLVKNGKNPPWSLIYKNARYSEEEIAGLEGLPIRPGPPEYSIYASGGEALAAYLPACYMSREVIEGRHYRYLLEDLGGRYATRRDGRHALLLSRKLPEVHGALKRSLEGSRTEGRLLTFDEEFSAGILDYAERNLRRLAETYRMARLDRLLADRERLSEIYSTLAAEIHPRLEAVPIHGDLNPWNVLFSREDAGRFKLIDWEWAGYGLPHADLAALLKSFPPQVEKQAVEAYSEASGGPHAADDWTVYRWCKLQRGLFDAAFFAKQKLDAASPAANLDVDSHIDAALGRALDALRALGERAPVRSPL